MKRLLLSVLGGFVIPFLYSVVVVLLVLNIIPDKITVATFAMFPVRWPILLLFRLGMMRFENEMAMLIYIIACNVALYSLLTYALLWGFSKRKSRQVATPPNPPTYN